MFERFALVVGLALFAGNALAWDCPDGLRGEVVNIQTGGSHPKYDDGHFDFVLRNRANPQEVIGIAVRRHTNLNLSLLLSALHTNKDVYVACDKDGVTNVLDYVSLIGDDY